MFNIFESPDETISDLIKAVIEVFSSKINILLEPRDINSAFRLGKMKGNRPILIKFQCFWQKIEILRASRNLKESNIRISDDYSTDVRERRKKLIPYLIKARQENHMAILKKDKLIINGHQISLDKCENLFRINKGAEETAEVEKLRNDIQMKEGKLLQEGSDHPDNKICKETREPEELGNNTSSGNKNKNEQNITVDLVQAGTSSRKDNSNVITPRRNKRKGLPRSSPLRKVNSIESFIRRFETKSKLEEKQEKLDGSNTS